MRDCEILAKEIMQRYRGRVYTMSNVPLADEIVNELRREGLAPAIVELSSVQYIAMTQRAKRQLVKLLKCRQKKLREELAELERCQKEIEDGTVGNFVRE